MIASTSKQKAKMNMNRTNLSFRTFKRLRFRPLAGLLLPAFMLCLLGSAWGQQQQQPIAAAIMEATPSENHGVPFKGVFATQFQIIVVFPIGHISVTGQGHASHLGATTAVTNNQELNLITDEVTATYVLTGANGDTVILEMDSKRRTFRAA